MQNEYYKYGFVGFVLPVTATTLLAPFISKAVRENDKTGYAVTATIVILLLILGNLFMKR